MILELMEFEPEGWEDKKSLLITLMSQENYTFGQLERDIEALIYENK